MADKSVCDVCGAAVSKGRLRLHRFSATCKYNLRESLRKELAAGERPESISSAMRIHDSVEASKSKALGKALAGYPAVFHDEGLTLPSTSIVFYDVIPSPNSNSRVAYEIFTDQQDEIIGRLTAAGIPYMKSADSHILDQVFSRQYRAIISRRSETADKISTSVRETFSRRRHWTKEYADLF